MSKDLKIFEKEELGQVRVVLNEENEPLFCLADVCKILGLDNTSKVKNRLDVSGVYLIDNHALNSKEGVKINMLGNTKTNYITESNLYKCIFQSRKEEAEMFTDWVTKEVLPSIRKHGIYATDNIIEQIINNPDLGIELLTKLKEERAKRKEAERRNNILMHVNKTYTITEVAKELNMRSAIELNKKLEEKGIQFKINNTWVMKSDYSNLGYEQIKQEVLDDGRVIYHRRITQYGREFILNLFDKKS